MQDCTASAQLEAEVAGSGVMLGEQLMRCFLTFTEIKMSNGFDGAISGAGGLLQAAFDGLANLPDAKKDPAGFATGMQKVALSMQVASTAQSAVSETIKAFGEGTKGAAHNIS